MAVADINSDGKPDLLTANYSSSTVGVLLGTGAGIFGAATALSLGPLSNPDNLAVADVNGDGKLDLLVARRGRGAVGHGHR
ncbi:MAG: FG-GAP repeat domain-containing protein [Janthinobacterium lividum]